jgi:hypothetical protein
MEDAKAADVWQRTMQQSWLASGMQSEKAAETCSAWHAKDLRANTNLGFRLPAAISTRDSG